MDWGLIASGLVIGVVVAAPVGPVNLICLRRAIAFGPFDGFLSGSGAALGDGVLAAIAAFGLTAISKAILGLSLWLQGFGGLVLLGIGVHTYLTAPTSKIDNTDVTHTDRLHLVATTFLLTVSNPATILGFIAIMGGVGGFVPRQPSFIGAAVLVISVIAGSLGWWLALAAITGHVRHRLSDRTFVLINHGSGALITLFGVAVLVKLARDLLT